MNSIIVSNPFTDSHPIASSSSSDYDAASQLDVGRIISDFEYEYREREDENLENTSVHWRRTQFEEWREWYITNYPSTNPKRLVKPHGKDLDLRVLFMALPIAGYSILLFLEICHDVDKILCGSDSSTLSRIQQWHTPQEMGAFKYLLSEELYLWWKTELCEFSNEIRNPTSNRVSIIFRLRELGGALIKMDELVDCGRDSEFVSHTISARIWNEYFEGECDVFEPPEGMFRGIFGRWSLLKDSFKIFTEEVKQMEQREDRVISLVPFSQRNTESVGLRNRIPRGQSPESVQDSQQSALLSGTHNGEASQNSGLPAFPSHQFHRTPSISTSSRYKEMVERILNSHRLVKTGLGIRRLWGFFIHTETFLVVFSCCVAASAVFMAISIQLSSTPTQETCKVPLNSDSNFFSNVSQTILSILSVYLIILPIARSRSLGLRYRFWFWGCLLISFVSSILSLGLYSQFSIVSGILGWIGTFAQAAIALLLTQSIEKASKAGSIDSIELHVH